MSASQELVRQSQAHGAQEETEPKLDSSSLVIGVMGLTGSGKSTLISVLTGQDVKVGHKLKACTSEVSVFCTTWRGRTIFLVDTPGFDDSFRSDSDVLKDIAFWLSQAYAKEIKLAGMIYLHRITDPRMGGVAVKNVHMFEKLCGGSSMSNVVLGTTMWDDLAKVDPTLARGIEHEQELLEDPNFWK